MNAIKRVLVVLIILAASACTEPGRTTSVGAATGGVIGAGLGAIVGNQVGSTGAGLAIGAASGAAAGAAIGNALESNEKRFAQQGEKIKRQDQEIEAQKKMMAELRKKQEDSTSASLRASAMQDSYAWGNDEWGKSKGSQKWAHDPSVRYATSKEIDVARNRTSAPIGFSASSTGDSSARARMAPAMVAPAIAGPAKMAPEAEVVESHPSSARPIAKLTTDKPTTSSVTERDLTGADTSAAVAVQDENKKIDSLKVENEAQNAAPVAALASQDSEECKGAQQEASKASAASETADKLFHIRRALRMCPSNADFHHELGKLYKYLGRNSDAKFEFDEAIRINPSHQEAKASLSGLGN